MKNNIVMKMLRVTPVTTGKCLPWSSSLGVTHGNYPQGVHTAQDIYLIDVKPSYKLQVSD